jgi:hypothetical protein
MLVKDGSKTIIMTDSPVGLEALVQMRRLFRSALFSSGVREAIY